MSNDIFKIDKDSDDSKKGSFFDDSEFKFGDDGDFEIGKTAEDKPSTDASSDEGTLDDSRLSDDFVIGQDFFIDSSDADDIASEEKKNNQKKKKRKKKKASAGKGCLLSIIWMAAILIISISAAALILYFGIDYLGVNFDADSAEENIEIVVVEGTSAKEVAEMLKDKGVIDSPLFFRFYSSRGGYAAKFRDGIYYFSKQDSYEDIAEKLTKQGTQAESVKVTIPEGWTIDQMAARFEENKICTAAQFKEAVNEATYDKYPFEFMKGIKDETQGVHYRLEGYLFPDTYYFYQTNNKSGAEQAIKKMLQNFDNKLIPSMRIQAEKRGVSLHDVVTMASIIEMEASVADYSDKQKVSAVFWNRIDNWGNSAFLQSDPTTKYKYNTDRYDTYKAVGLAPGAYCAPGIDAIKAALYPSEGSDDYFFVTDKNMKFYFTKDNDEHNRVIRDLKNKGLWLNG
ncbi:MAG: endolytic transglycosylase MltG [Clostridia bacterium]|nr:endolytic transglycosylase MltG [Clostridia bacterium]